MAGQFNKHQFTLFYYHYCIYAKNIVVLESMYIDQYFKTTVVFFVFSQSYFVDSGIFSVLDFQMVSFNHILTSRFL